MNIKNITSKVMLFIIGLVGATIAFVGLCALFTVPVYFLWNWLMPVIFGLPEITFWQALGLKVLCAMLFKFSKSEAKAKE